MNNANQPHTLYVEKNGRMVATFIQGTAEHCRAKAFAKALHTQAGRDAHKITGWKVAVSK
jgi:hypothetical protein